MDAAWVERILRRELREAGRRLGEALEGDTEPGRARAVTGELLDVLLNVGGVAPFYELRTRAAELLEPLLVRETGADALARLLHLPPVDDLYTTDIRQDVLEFLPAVSGAERAYLLGQLEHLEPEVREGAVRALWATANEERSVAWRLLPLLEDEEYRVGQAVARGLRSVIARDAPMRDRVLALLSFPVRGTRSAAIAALEQAAIEREDVAWALVPLLGEGRRISLVLRDVLCHAVEAHPVLVRDVLPFLTAADTKHCQDVLQIRRSARGAPAAVITDIVKAILPLLKDVAAPVRAQAASVLGSIAGDRATVAQAIVPLLTDTESIVQMATAAGLPPSALSEAMVVADLLPHLRGPNDARRGIAALALRKGVRNYPVIVDEALVLLHDDNPMVRHRACLLLGEGAADRDDIVIALLPLLADDDVSVRHVALLTLVPLAARAQVGAALLALLPELASGQRPLVLSALARLHPPHPRVKQELVAALDGDDESLRETAWRWLDRNAETLLT